MSKTNNLGDFLADLADAIRAKRGTTAQINAQDMADEIGLIETGGTLPTLNAPSISISGDTLTITNPSTNGNFVTGYKVYGNSVLLAAVTTTTVNLRSYMTVEGEYSITATATGENFEDSAESSPASYEYIIPTLDTPQPTIAGNTVSWQAVSNATAYQVIADSTAGTPVNVSSTSYSLALLNLADGDHTIYVRAIGDETNYKTSAWSTGTSYFIPYELAPTLDTDFQSGSDSVIEWSEIENASGYDIMVEINGEYVKKGEVTPTPPTPTMPQKGDLIEMDLAGDPVSGVTLGTTYRVLNVNGTVAEVLAMTNASDSMTFNDDFVNTYAGSTLDNYLTTDVYNALNATAKAALVPKTLRQDSWYWGDSGNPDYPGYYGTTKPGTTAYTVSLGSTTFGEEISRSIYALSMQDVIDYVKDTTLGDGELQNYNIWKMFWNDEVSHSEYLWLRSADAGNPYDAWYVNGINGSLYDDDADYEDAVRPALNIDLSKIEWRAAAN